MPAESASAHVLELRALTVTYDDMTAVDSVDLHVRAGEVVALLGPSGSGKSTLLHAVAGFRPPAGGEIWLQGRCVASPVRAEPPERRDVAVVFQNYALWPHLSALDTVAYPIRRRGGRRRAARDEAHGLLERLGMGHLAARRPAELSGGEQQRVGLARALARQASLYLFDEPTAHLDTHVRGVFLDELVTRQEATGAGGLYATHDAEEALGLADRVALLNRGHLVQLGTPRQVYDEPVDLWAARLTGPASTLDGMVVNGPAGLVSVNVAGVVLAVDAPAGVIPAGTAVSALVRPEWARLGGDLRGRLRTVRFQGPHSDHVVETESGELVIREPGPPRYAPGDLVNWSLQRLWPLTARSTVP